MRCWAVLLILSPPALRVNPDLRKVENLLLHSSAGFLLKKRWASCRHEPVELPLETLTDRVAELVHVGDHEEIPGSSAVMFRGRRTIGQLPEEQQQVKWLIHCVIMVEARLKHEGRHLQGHGVYGSLWRRSPR